MRALVELYVADEAHGGLGVSDTIPEALLHQTTPEERRVELNWPSPLPENEMEKLDEAEAKLRLGVDRAIVLRELGY